MKGVSGIKIIKRINTNAALAEDGQGNEIVVFGKGIGFPQVPYELKDLSKIERTFYGIAPKFHRMISELPQEIILVSAEIVEQAETELKCDLNPNLPFTLADHLNFAISRSKTDLIIPTPLSYDVRHLYPVETAIGFKALKILKDRLSFQLPDSEAYSVALHIINAEKEGGVLTNAMATLSVIQDVEQIVEDHYQMVLDKESYSYSRFIMHLQYLIQRLSSGEQIEERSGSGVVREVARECPDAYLCAKSISDFLEKKYGWSCNNEELLYLMLHIQRLSAKD